MVSKSSASAAAKLGSFSLTVLMLFMILLHCSHHLGLMCRFNFESWAYSPVVSHKHMALVTLACCLSFLLTVTLSMRYQCLEWGCTQQVLLWSGRQKVVRWWWESNVLHRSSAKVGDYCCICPLLVSQQLSARLQNHILLVHWHHWARSTSWCCSLLIVCCLVLHRTIFHLIQVAHCGGIGPDQVGLIFFCSRSCGVMSWSYTPLRKLEDFQTR